MIYFPGIESESKGFSLNWLHKIQHRITGSRDAPKETIKSDKAGRYFGVNSEVNEWAQKLSKSRDCGIPCTLYTVSYVDWLA